MRENIETLTLAEIAAFTRGTILRGNPETPITAISTDSRNTGPGTLFAALKGEKRDAHDFVPQAAASAGAVLIHRDLPVPAECAVIRVADTLLAYGDIAHGYRMKFRPVMTAVTGTSGKTTTKEFLSAISRRRFRTLATSGNYNNQIGVPFTLFGMNHKTEKAVIELGMSYAGEIARLAVLAAPRLGIITTVGPCHLEDLKSVENVLNAKAELIEYLNANSGTVILDRDHEHFASLAERVTCRLVTVGAGPGADYRARDIIAEGYEPARFRCFGVEVVLRHAGRHVISNAMLAAAAADLMGISRLDIIEGLSASYPIAGRGGRMEMDGAVLVDDCYNANPLSYAAALSMLATSRANRRIVVMADMLELGPEKVRFHEELGRRVAASRVDVLLHRGEMAAHAARTAEASGLRRIGCSSNEELAAELDKILLPGDVVLVKASHGMRLDEVIEGIRARRARGGEVVRLKK